MLDRTAFCPACDRDVPVLRREQAREGRGELPHAVGVFLCLDYGVRCTGAMCPLAALPRTAAERAAHREGVVRFHGGDVSSDADRPHADALLPRRRSRDRTS